MLKSSSSSLSLSQSRQVHKSTAAQRSSSSSSLGDLSRTPNDVRMFPGKQQRQQHQLRALTKKETESVTNNGNNTKTAAMVVSPSAPIAITNTPDRSLSQLLLDQNEALAEYREFLMLRRITAAQTKRNNNNSTCNTSDISKGMDSVGKLHVGYSIGQDEDEMFRAVQHHHQPLTRLILPKSHLPNTTSSKPAFAPTAVSTTTVHPETTFPWVIKDRLLHYNFDCNHASEQTCNNSAGPQDMRHNSPRTATVGSGDGGAASTHDSWDAATVHENNYWTTQGTMTTTMDNPEEEGVFVLDL